MADSVILLQDVTVQLGGTAALRDVSLAVEPGELLALIGPNGSGKSTLLMLLNGLRRAASGTVTVCGTNPAGLHGGQLARLRHRVAYVPQLPERDRAIPLSVRDVARIGRSGKAGLFHRLTVADEEVVSAWLDRLALTSLADRPYCDLSGGEQRKVHLARALAQEPDVLLLDEPASNLDIRWQEELTRIVHDLWRETDLTVVLVTHDVHQVPAGCEHMALLSKGRLVAAGAPEAVLEGGRLASVFGSPVEVLQRGGRWHLLPLSPSEER
ncbi:MAG: ABC transporter ATP-binding protein [Planctomycetes bacterium]|nr:ABC transporter ATP-binding protein [Planctomycetota bacterium]